MHVACRVGVTRQHQSPRHDGLGRHGYGDSSDDDARPTTKPPTGPSSAAAPTAVPDAQASTAAVLVDSSTVTGPSVGSSLTAASARFRRCNLYTMMAVLMVVPTAAEPATPTQGRLGGAAVDSDSDVDAARRSCFAALSSETRLDVSLVGSRARDSLVSATEWHRLTVPESP